GMPITRDAPAGRAPYYASHQMERSSLLDRRDLAHRDAHRDKMERSSLLDRRDLAHRDRMERSTRRSTGATLLIAIGWSGRACSTDATLLIAIGWSGRAC